LFIPDPSDLGTPEAPRTIAQVSEHYHQVLDRRRGLEAEAELLKNGLETQLKEQLLRMMAAEGLKSCRLADGGQLVVRSKNQFRITDANVFAKTCLREMAKALKEGRPLVDGLIYQQRAHEGKLKDIFGIDGASERPDLGLTVVATPNLVYLQS